MKNTENGQCHCGKITYKLNREKIISAHHCHCSDCQKITGSGKATIIYIPKKHIEINGEVKFYQVKGSSGLGVKRGFCENCGSGIYSYLKELPHILFVKAGTLEDSSWLTIDSNFFTDSAKSWSMPDQSLKSFNKNPGIASTIKTLIKSF